MDFRGIASASLATGVLPTYGAIVEGNGMLMTAQPYAQRMILSSFAIGSSTTSTSGTSMTASAPSAATATTSESQVVFALRPYWYQLAVPKSC